MPVAATVTPKTCSESLHTSALHSHAPQSSPTQHDVGSPPRIPSSAPSFRSVILPAKRLEVPFSRYPQLELLPQHPHLLPRHGKLGLEQTETVEKLRVALHVEVLGRVVQHRDPGVVGAFRHEVRVGLEERAELEVDACRGGGVSPGKRGGVEAEQWKVRTTREARKSRHA